MCRISLFLVLIMISGTRVCLAEAVQMSDDELAYLKRGDVLLQTIHQEKSGGAVRVTALFHGGAETIWNIIGHCKYELIYVRGIKLCEVLAPGKIHKEVL